MTGAHGEPRTVRFRIDLHVHTAPRSLDSGLRPEVAVERAIEAGLDAICLAEHNTIWPEDEIRALTERTGFPVLRGMEVSTDVGHVLVFGLERYSFEMGSVERLRRIVESEGAAMALAHPSREPGYGGPWERAAGLFEALEAFNGDESLHSRAWLSRMAEHLGIAAVGGSDAHTADAIGRCATGFSRVILNEQALIAAIRSRTAWPLAED